MREVFLQGTEPVELREGESPRLRPEGCRRVTNEVSDRLASIVRTSGNHRANADGVDGRVHGFSNHAAFPIVLILVSQRRGSPHTTVLSLCSIPPWIFTI